MSSVHGALTILATIGLTAVLLAGAGFAARRSPGGRSAAPVVMAVVVLWVTTTMFLAAGGAFASDPDTRAPLIGAGIVLPVVVGVVAYRSIGSFHDLVSSIPLHLVIGAQLYRVLGALFLLAWAQGELPGEFALPAGIGDIAVGMAAPAVAYAVYKRVEGAGALAIGWNLVGLVDLLVAVSFGLLTSPSVFQQLALDAPNFAITRFPLVLVPTFAVPVFILLHLLALRHPDARAVKTPVSPGYGSPARS